MVRKVYARQEILGSNTGLIQKPVPKALTNKCLWAFSGSVSYHANLISDNLITTRTKKKIFFSAMHVYLLVGKHQTYITNKKYDN